MTADQFDSFPALITRRLELRKLSKNDVNEVFLLRSDDSVNKFLDRKVPRTKKDAADFIEGTLHQTDMKECLYWAINLIGSIKLIGTICLWNFSTGSKSAELGYELYPLFQGKGFMHESVIEVTRYGFEIMKLESITAYSRYDNIKSIELLKHCGFLPIKESESIKSNESVNMRGYIQVRP